MEPMQSVDKTIHKSTLEYKIECLLAFSSLGSNRLMEQSQADSVGYFARRNMNRIRRNNVAPIYPYDWENCRYQMYCSTAWGRIVSSSWTKHWDMRSIFRFFCSVSWSKPFSVSWNWPVDFYLRGRYRNR